MSPYQFPRPLRIGLYATAATILFVMCILPSRDLPDPGTGDKFEHLAAWFILTMTGYILAPRRLLAIPAFALAYGAFIEVAQFLAPTGRHGDVTDLVADSVGVGIAVVLFLAARRLAPR